MKNLRIITVIVLYIIFSIVSFGQEADTANTNMARLYADTVIDGLNGRTWLVTNGRFDTAIRQRAKERNIELTIVPITFDDNDVVLEFEKSAAKLGNPKLEAAAGLGAVPFIFTWLADDPETALKQLALVANPALAKIGGYVALPHGIVFHLVKQDDINKDVLKSAMRLYLETRDDIGETIALSSLEETDFASFELRRLAGLAGNNLAVLLYGAEMPDEAMTVLLQAGSIDSTNISILLNKAVIVKRGIRPELGEKLVAELASLNSNPNINWELASINGFVISPEEFLPVKYYWALSGVSLVETDRLNNAIAAIEDENVRSFVENQLRNSMALQSYGAQSALFLIARFPQDGELTMEYMMEMAKTLHLQGNIKRALRWAKRAEATNTEDNIQAAILISDIYIKGKFYANAVNNLIRFSEKISPETLPALYKLMEIYLNNGNNTEMVELGTKIIDSEYAEEWLKFTVEGIKIMDKNQGEARELLDKAVEANPGIFVPYIPLLQLDMVLNDKASAEKHASKMLEIDHTNGFANYVMGIVFAERKEFARAEMHFQFALANYSMWFVFNDYAAMIVEASGNYQMAAFLAKSAIENGGDSYAAVWDTYA